MDANTYYLELMPILLNIFQLQKLMNKHTKAESLHLRKKDMRHQNKTLIENLLELIQVMQEKVMIQAMMLVKHLSVYLKTKKEKNQMKK